MQVVLKPFVHRHTNVIGIFFDYSNDLNVTVRKLPGVKWSQSYKCWYLPQTNDALNQVAASVKGLAKLDTSALQAYIKKDKIVKATLPDIKTKSTKPVSKSAAWNLSALNLTELNRFIEQLKLKAYSAATIKTYRNEFMQLLQMLKEKPVQALTPEDLRRYMLYITEKGLSVAGAHSRLNAVKFYFEQVLGKEKFFWEIPRPKKPMPLPRFFNQDEIAFIINATTNLKHKAMLMLAYSSGLRVSEVISIRTHHIDSNRMSILIEQAKGKKDRLVKLSPVLLVMLREYWKKYQPAKGGYLFTGQHAAEAYSSRSLQLVLAAAKKKAGILKPGSIHALRHSFATHLLDKGTDVTMIMKLLGHNDIKTTLRYLHVTNRDILDIISPLDDLKLKS